MENKTYKQLVSRIEKLEKNKTAVINSFRSKLEEYKRKYQEASVLSTPESDADTFVVNLEIKDNAEKYIKYYTAKIQQIESESLFTDEEHDSIIESIRSEQQKISDTSFRKIVTLLNEVFAVYDDCSNQVKQFTDLKTEVDNSSNKPSDNAVSMYFNYDPYNFLKYFIGKFEHNCKHHPTYGYLFDKQK